MVSYGPAQLSDLPAMAELYQQSFPEALTAVFGRPRIPTAAVEDGFKILLTREPAGLRVARDGSGLIGCLAAVHSFRQIERALWSREVWRLAGRWLSGRYRGLGLGFVPRLGRALWDYRQAPAAPRAEEPMAQILTAMVRKDRRGEGIGKALFAQGLDYLRGTEARSVRLEVDAAKTGPLRLYEQFGFREAGRIPSPRGPAIVMLLRLEARSPSA